MARIKKKLARRSLKATARHTVQETASKLKRDPFRSATLVGVGALAGALAGWLVGRTSDGSGAPTTTPA